MVAERAHADLQGPGEHLMNLFSFLLPHTRVPGAPHNSEALVRTLNCFRNSWL